MSNSDAAYGSFGLLLTLQSGRFFFFFFFAANDDGGCELAAVGGVCPLKCLLGSRGDEFVQDNVEKKKGH